MAKRKKSKKKAPTEVAVEATAPAVAETDKPGPQESVAPLAAEVTPALEATASVPANATDEAHTEVAEDSEDSEDSGSSDVWPEAPAEQQTGTDSWPWPEGADEAAAAAPAEGEPAAGEPGAEAVELVPEGLRLESIVESLLFASDKPLGLSDLKRLLGERDGKKITAAVQSLIEQRKGTGIEVAALSNGWLLRTSPDNAPWVSRLLVGKPLRLSRAMLETLAIVAYRQPVTRPEIDDIRGVDCGPVLKTLLDRGLIRIIGKKEEVGRPILYGTTPEFLRVFNLRELAELPTLREFYDLSAEDQSRVEAEHGPPPDAANPAAPNPGVALDAVARGELPPEADETDPLLDEIDEASRMAKKALGDLEPRASEETGSQGDEPQGGKDVAKQDGKEDGTADGEASGGESESLPAPNSGE